MKKTIFLLILLSSCFKPEDYEYKSEDVITNVSLSKSHLIANNQDTLTIHVELMDGTPEDTKVKITANHGRFIKTGNSVITTDSKEGDSSFAEELFVSSVTTDDLILTIEVGEYKVDTTIRMINNSPTDLIIQSDSVGIHNTGNALLEFTVQYKSNNGKVSIGNFSTMTVQNSEGEPIGTLLPSAGYSDQNGTCKYIYSLLPNLNPPSPLFAIGSIKNDSGIIIPCDTLTFYVYE